MMDRIAKLREFLKANPDDGFLNHALALEHIKINDVAGAKMIFENLLKREPGYVGSYYHLAKLYEAEGQTAQAIKWYEQGIEEAKKAGDQHALNELQAAYEDLVY
jgi:Tfp pilus assembly protein PilF